jgi:predicted aldo/keto reductase-like oxidoreductase
MLGYGAMELRGAPRARDITDTQANTILNAALGSGINSISQIARSMATKTS